jgi:hypothetical protein
LSRFSIQKNATACTRFIILVGICECDILRGMNLDFVLHFFVCFLFFFGVSKFRDAKKEQKTLIKVKLK